MQGLVCACSWVARQRLVVYACRVWVHEDAACLGLGSQAGLHKHCMGDPDSYENTRLECIYTYTCIRRIALRAEYGVIWHVYNSTSASLHCSESINASESEKRTYTSNGTPHRRRIEIPSG